MEARDGTRTAFFLHRPPSTVNRNRTYICAHRCRVLERTVGAGAFRATDTGITWRCRCRCMQCNQPIVVAITQS
eukprot:7297652-Prymnesium_polylepis.1